MRKLFLLALCSVFLFSASSLIFSKATHAATFGTVTKTIVFGKTASRSRSRTITIPDLGRVTHISVNTGHVSGAVTANQLTVHVWGGQWVSRQAYTDPKKYSKWVRRTRIDHRNTFPNAIWYTDGGGYRGRIYKGDSWVDSRSVPDYAFHRISGTFYQWRTPSYRPTYFGNWHRTDMAEATYVNVYSKGLGRMSHGVFKGQSSCHKWESMGGGWSSVVYRDGGCPLTWGREWNDLDGKRDFAKIGDWFIRPYYITDWEWTAVYKTFHQTYQGTVYRPGTSYRNYRYAYTVTIRYKLQNQLNAKIVHTQKWADRLNIARSDPHFIAGESFIVLAKTSGDATRVVVIPPEKISRKRVLHPDKNHTRWSVSMPGNERLRDGLYKWMIRATYKNDKIIQRPILIAIKDKVILMIHLTE